MLPPSMKRSLKTALDFSGGGGADLTRGVARMPPAILVEVEVEFPPSFVVAHPDIFLKLHENLGK